jgi:hypothetical protein
VHSSKPLSFDDAVQESFFLHECIPLVDGGALLTLGDTGQRGVWYVYRGEAVRVREVSAISVVPQLQHLTEREAASWLQLQQEKRKVEERPAQ